MIGYDLINEPWPGTTWEPCATDPKGCPAQDAVLNTEWGALTDPAIINRQAGLLDDTMLPWISWAYNEGVQGDL